MKLIFVVLLSILISCSQAQNTTPLYKQNHNINIALNAVKNSDDVKHCIFGFYAVDVNTGEVLSQYNQEIALKPASNMKLVSTATLLELYGPDYRFETRLAYTGTIDTLTKTLNGTIYIIGGGDPSLGSKFFDQTSNNQFLNDWVNAIKNLNITQINGQIIADASIYSHDITPPTWSWEDMGNYFGAGASGLSIYDNFYTLTYKTGTTVGTKAEIIAYEHIPENLSIDNTVLAGNTSDDDSYIFGAPYTYHRFIRGELPANRNAFLVKGSQPDPALYAASVLCKQLENEGITTTAKPATTYLQNSKLPENYIVIHTYKSPTVFDIITATNKHSINLFAEHCLNHASLKLNEIAETKAASKAITAFWAQKGMNTAGIAINDGSGLSQYNLITPVQMVFLLQYMKTKSKYYTQFYNSLPIAGESGTIKSVLKGTVAQGNIHAKSGSIKNVRAYSGYATSASGREIAFSVMFNNFTVSSSTMRKHMEALMLSLVQFNK